MSSDGSSSSSHHSTPRRRQYILYLEPDPASPLARYVRTLWAEARAGALGGGCNAAELYPPHASLTGFFPLPDREGVRPSGEGAEERSVLSSAVEQQQEGSKDGPGTVGDLRCTSAEHGLVHLLQSLVPPSTDASAIGRGDGGWSCPRWAPPRLSEPRPSYTLLLPLALGPQLRDRVVAFAQGARAHLGIPSVRVKRMDHLSLAYGLEDASAGMAGTGRSAAPDAVLHSPYRNANKMRDLLQLAYDLYPFPASAPPAPGVAHADPGASRAGSALGHSEPTFHGPDVCTSVRWHLVLYRMDLGPTGDVYWHALCRLPYPVPA